MMHKDEYIRGSVDIAVLAIASTLEILLFLASWTKLLYATLPGSAQSFIDSHIMYNLPVLYWMWSCLPNVHDDPTLPFSVFISPLAIFAYVVLASGIWLKYQLRNLWVAMAKAKEQERVARFTGRSSSQSIGFGSIHAGGDVSLAQTMGSDLYSKPELPDWGKSFAHSPLWKIIVPVAVQALVLLVTKIMQ